MPCMLTTLSQHGSSCSTCEPHELLCDSFLESSGSNMCCLRSGQLKRHIDNKTRPTIRVRKMYLVAMPGLLQSPLKLLLLQLQR